MTYPTLTLAVRPEPPSEANTPRWQNAANCRDIDTGVFFSDLGGAQPYTKAREICRACTVRAECLDDTLRSDHGFSGGMTPRQRAAELSRRLRATS